MAIVPLEALNQEVVEVAASKLRFNVPGNIITAFFQNTDLLRNFRWRLTIPTEADVGIDIRPEDCQSLDLPFPEIDPVPWTRNGSTKYFPSSVQHQGVLTVNFYEHSSARIISSLEAWRGLIRNPNGTRNYSRFYKRNLILELTDGLKVPKMEITFKGCWPTRTSLSSLTYEGNAAAVIITQAFSVDDIDFKATDAKFRDMFKSPGALLKGVRELTGF